MSAGRGRARAAPDDLRAHIRELEERLLDPSVRRDRDAVGALLADGFRELGSSGRVLDRTATLDALASEGENAPRRTLSDFSLAVLGPDAVLATWRATARTGSGAAPRRSLRSSVWVRRASRWQILFHQGTPEPEGPREGPG